jgi:FkbM family methyltransferase
MINYFIKSYKRKIARRITKKYPFRVDSFDIEGVGEIKFANWENPLIERKEISIDNIDFFRKFLSEGDFAIDIGSNIGLMTTEMAIVNGKKGLTLAFDPNPLVYEVLSENIKLNPEKTNMAAHNVAITDKEEEFYYNSSEASFGNGGLSLTNESKHGKYTLSTKVKGVVLEALLKKEYAYYIPKLKLIKIDTEGYDKEVIKSISNLLKQYKPALISEVYEHNKTEEKFEQFEVIKSLGYSVFYFSDFTSNAEVVEIKVKEDMLKWRHFDIYAILQEK